MPKQSIKSITKKPKRPRDVNQLAQQLVRESTEERDPEPLGKATPSEISRVMSELGRRGGKIGGRKRAESMSKEKRHEIARKAARSRWDNTAAKRP